MIWKKKINVCLQVAKSVMANGVKVIEAMEGPTTPTKPKDSVNDGFAWWPQPYWWTRPPAWVDDIPAWMQRLELKKAHSMHKAAVFG